MAQISVEGYGPTFTCPRCGAPADAVATYAPPDVSGDPHPCGMYTMPCDHLITDEERSTIITAMRWA